MLVLCVPPRRTTRHLPQPTFTGAGRIELRDGREPDEDDLDA
jgi:hypothetical protein